MSFTLSRLPLEPRRRRLAVRAIEELSSRYRRVVLEGPELLPWNRYAAPRYPS